MNAKRIMVLNSDGLIETITVPTEERPMTPTGALAAWEAANARKEAAKQEQYLADAAWVEASKVLAEVIDAATPGNTRGPVIIAGKVVEVEWDGYWRVSVQTPPVLS
jgi:hypothetical protein